MYSCLNDQTPADTPMRLFPKGVGEESDRKNRFPPACFHSGLPILTIFNREYLSKPGRNQSEWQMAENTPGLFSEIFLDGFRCPAYAQGKKEEGECQMIPTLIDGRTEIEIQEKPPVHDPPHLHTALEIAWLQEGSLALGCGKDLYDMHPGDLGIVFPGLIHHYQAFDGPRGSTMFLIVPPSCFAPYTDFLNSRQPVNPVLPADRLHPDVQYALTRLRTLHRAAARPRSAGGTISIQYSALLCAFLQIILAQVLPLLTLEDRPARKDQDPVFQTIAYAEEHFRENLSESRMAKDLGISESALSRVFSARFHRNFHSFLNEVRLRWVTQMLRDTEQPITEIALDAGFQSQATFNRVFLAAYHVTPREYRKNAQDAALRAQPDPFV